MLLTSIFVFLFEEDKRHKHHSMNAYKGHQSSRILSFSVQWWYGGKRVVPAASPIRKGLSFCIIHVGPKVSWTLCAFTFSNGVSSASLLPVLCEGHFVVERFLIMISFLYLWIFFIPSFLFWFKRDLSTELLIPWLT